MCATLSQHHFTGVMRAPDRRGHLKSSNLVLGLTVFTGYFNVVGILHGFGPKAGGVTFLEAAAMSLSRSSPRGRRSATTLYRGV